MKKLTCKRARPTAAARLFEEPLDPLGLNPLGGRSHGGLWVGTDCMASSSTFGFGGGATGTAPTAPFDFTRLVCATRSKNRLSSLYVLNIINHFLCKRYNKKGYRSP